MGDAGGKLEAAKKPDRGEGDRTTRERAARGDRAGWPAERRQGGGGLGDWEEFKWRGDPRAQGEPVGKRSDRAPRRGLRPVWKLAPKKESSRSAIGDYRVYIW